MSNPKHVTRKPLIAGLILLGLGVVLLFWTQNFLEGLVRWWPSVISALGIWLGYRGIFAEGRAWVLFLGLLLLGNGIFMLLFNNVLDNYFTLSQLWPVFVGIVGAALIPYGLKSKRRPLRIALVVPGAFLLALSFFFLLFSLKVMTQSLSDFVVAWWPLFLVIMGLVLIITYYLRSANSQDQKPGDSGS